jgi:hypothetical protein
MVVMCERNRTAHEIMLLVISTQQDMDWVAREVPQDGAKWAAVAASAPADVRYCRRVSEAATRDRIAQSAV